MAKAREVVHDSFFFLAAHLSLEEVPVLRWRWLGVRVQFSKSMNMFRAQSLTKYQCSSVFLANELIWGMKIQVLGVYLHVEIESH